MSPPVSFPSAEEALELRRRLCAWFARSGRDLPWRRTRDPYAIWISEAMLQQTRVEAVLPYFRRFLERLPDLESLAAAQEDEVVALWSGLGYYRRARALRRAAQRILDEHGGRFPDRLEGALDLPGVGPYTAGAVLSIAYDRSEPVVDGNVTRVLARLFELEGPLEGSDRKRELWNLARRLVPPEGSGGPDGPGAWNQALMELGATLCTPRTPRCGDCPLVELCRGHRAGRQADLPVPRPRRAAVDVPLEVFLVRSGGGILLEHRPPGGRMAGLWELPTRELPGPDGARSGLWPAEPGLRGESLDLRAGERLGEVSHGITHHRIRATVRRAELRGPLLPPAPGCAQAHSWSDAQTLLRLGLTGLSRKILTRFPEPLGSGAAGG